MARRKRYSSEFKLQAIKRADEPGVTDTLVADEIGVSTKQLRRWRDAFKEDGEAAFPGQGVTRDQELAKLKRELAKLKQERDFLAEAARYFAKEPK